MSSEEQLLEDSERLFTADRSFIGIELSPKKAKDQTAAFVFLGNLVAIVILSSFVFADADYDRKIINASWIDKGTEQLPHMVSLVCGMILVAAGIGEMWIRMLKTHAYYGALFAYVAGVVSLGALGTYQVGVGIKAGSPSLTVSGVATLAMFVCWIVLARLFREKLDFITMLFDLTGRAIRENPRIIPLTMLTAGIMVLVLTFFFSMLVAIVLLPPGRSGVSVLFWYTIFMAYWTVNVVLNAYRLAVAGSVSYWYFTKLRRSPTVLTTITTAGGTAGTGGTAAAAAAERSSKQKTNGQYTLIADDDDEDLENNGHARGKNNNSNGDESELARSVHLSDANPFPSKKSMASPSSATAAGIGVGLNSSYDNSGNNNMMGNNNNNNNAPMGGGFPMPPGGTGGGGKFDDLLDDNGGEGELDDVVTWRMYKIAWTHSLGSIALAGLLAGVLSTLILFLTLIRRSPRFLDPRNWRLSSFTRALVPFVPVATGPSWTSLVSVTGTDGNEISGSTPTRNMSWKDWALFELEMLLRTLRGIASFVLPLSLPFIPMHSLSLMQAVNRSYRVFLANKWHASHLVTFELAKRFMFFSFSIFVLSVSFIVIFTWMKIANPRRSVEGFFLLLVVFGAIYGIVSIFTTQVEIAVNTILVSHCEELEISKNVPIPIAMPAKHASTIAQNFSLNQPVEEIEPDTETELAAGSAAGAGDGSGAGAWYDENDNDMEMSSELNV